MNELLYIISLYKVHVPLADSMCMTCTKMAQKHLLLIVVMQFFAEMKKVTANWHKERQLYPILGGQVSVSGHVW